MKPLKVLLSLVLVSLMFLTDRDTSFAQAQTSEYQIWEQKQDVEPSHDWIITLNQEPNGETVNSDNIFITDSTGTRVDNSLTLNDEKIYNR